MPRFTAYRRWLIVFAGVAAIAAFALWPTPVLVDVVESVRGPLTVTIDEEGETRVRDRYVVSAPVTGRVLRLELEPGDSVVRGQTVVARILSEAPPLLDVRSLAEADAGVAAAHAGLGRAEAELRRAQAARDFAQSELRRQRELAVGQLTTAQAIDAAESSARNAEESVTAADFAVTSARSQLAQAEARRLPATTQSAGRILTVTAPVDGVVLKRLRESESVVGAGTPLVEIGNPIDDLEVVADLLSTDAVRVQSGAKVFVEQWGGDHPLTATVRRVEPSGFTKVSALGVEEQRVNVLMDFDDPSGAWKALGDGYRVEVRIVTWESLDVIRVPTSALVRQADGWTVFVVQDGRIRQVPAQIGHRNSREAEVISGIDAGRQVVTHPSDSVVDGARVEVRSLP